MRARGFTLLEMIVVLAILGLAVALVVPATLRSIDSWRRKAQMDELLDQIRALPGAARGSGRAIRIDEASLAGETPPLHVGEAWTLHAPLAWAVHANGVCEGGVVEIGNDYGMRRIRATAPFCEPKAE